MQFALIVRYGELFLKGKNRPLFLRQFRENLRWALRPFEGVRLYTYHGRYLVDNITNYEEVKAAVLRVFGISSISPALVISPTIEDAAAKGSELIRALPKLPESFRVRAKRSDKSFPHTSPEIGRLVGSLIYNEHKIPVDLTTPSLTLSVEIGPEISFVSTEKIPGAGGLPVGVSGHIELLLSGGIDSPVAAWQLLKRGARLSAVTFYSPPYVDETSKEKVRALCTTLRPWGGPERLHVVSFGQAQKLLRQQKPQRLAVLLYRRLMLRTAALFAESDGAKALATGESLGQVASQTLENMAAVEEATTLPVLRPLLTFDKEETIALAKRLGTYETSIVPHQDSCTLFLPPRPETKAKIADIHLAEEGLDLNAMAQELFSTAETLYF